MNCYLIVRGGLGNQMFQLVMGRSIERRFGCRVQYVDGTGFARVGRSWELGVFGVEPARVSIARRLVLTFLGRMAPELISEKAGALLGIASDRGCGLAALDHKRAPRLVNGYWQNFRNRYWNDEDARALFQFPAVPPRWRAFREQGQETIAAVHVRRGDYVLDPNARKVHGVCQEEWYRLAWEHLRISVPSACAIVFSDDIAWCKEHLKLGGNVTFRQSASTVPSWVDMAEMGRCDHLIISNSSYSWWAAYLGARKDSIVIAPKEWRVGVRTKDLGICPASWELI